MPLITGPLIASRQSLSNAVDLSGKKPFAVLTPPQWTDANLSFLFSPDGVTFYDLYQFGGVHRDVPCGANRALAVTSDLWPAGAFIKFQSGTIAAPVAQAAARQFMLMVA